MSRPLRALLVEDSPTDAEIVLRELAHAGYDVVHERVDDEASFRSALRRSQWDIVLSDFSMPRFNGIAAFDVLLAEGRDIPFIFVSGRIGEDRAAEAMKRGASDYILKDKLARLGPAVERELQDSEARKQRRQLAVKLRESEERFRYLFENSIQSIVVHRNFKPLFGNRALAETFGYRSVDEVLALDSVLALFAPHLHPQLREYARARAAGEPVPSHYEFEGMRKDGSRIWLENISWMVNWEGGPAIQSVYVEVTKQKVAESKLQARELMLKTVFDSLPLLASVKDLEGRYLFVSRLLLDAMGKTEGEVLRRTTEEVRFGTDEERAHLAGMERRCIESKRPVEDPDLRITHADGKVHFHHGMHSPLLDERGGVSAVVTVAQDLTEMRQLEEQYRQSQKLESIGRLAGGVAHDFNNMLSVILSYTEGLIQDCEPGSPMREDLQQVHAAGSRAAALTRQLLAFSRRQILELKPIQLNEVVANLDRFVGRLIGEDISVHFKLDPALPLVMADVGQIEQVIMNLVVNARDAMPDGGELIVESGHIELDEEYSDLHVGVKPGHYVWLGVTDTGIGMDADTKSRIFEPFFTTKEKGKGTGLGLATVYGIVNQLGGAVWVYSELGHGSTFKIYLPRADASAVAPPRDQAAPVELTGTESILLVEDDPGVRSAARRILEKSGYRIAAAANGREAIEMLHRDKSLPDLVLTDVVMPEMGGKQMVREIETAFGSTPVLFMSGYAEDSIVHNGVLEPGVNFLAKPFTRDTLLRKVREAIQSAQPRR